VNTSNARHLTPQHNELLHSIQEVPPGARNYHHLSLVIHQVADAMRSGQPSTDVRALIDAAVEVFALPSADRAATVEGVLATSLHLQLEGVSLTYAGAIEGGQSIEQDPRSAISELRPVDELCQQGAFSRAREVFSDWASHFFFTEAGSLFLPDRLPKKTSPVLSSWTTGFALLASAYRT